MDEKEKESEEMKMEYENIEKKESVMRRYEKRIEEMKGNNDKKKN